jgi:hypothetical protein
MRPDGTWDIVKLGQFFAHEDVEEILKIQTSRRNEEDFIAWFPDKRRVFSAIGLHLRNRCWPRIEERRVYDQLALDPTGSLSGRVRFLRK